MKIEALAMLLERDQDWFVRRTKNVAELNAADLLVRAGVRGRGNSIHCAFKFAT